MLLRYERLHGQPAIFQSLTGLRVAEFDGCGRWPAWSTAPCARASPADSTGDPDARDSGTPCSASNTPVI
jgi:hypothetical protein